MITKLIQFYIAVSLLLVSGVSLSQDVCPAYFHQIGDIVFDNLLFVDRHYNTKTYSVILSGGRSYEDNEKEIGLGLDDSMFFLKEIRETKRDKSCLSAVYDTNTKYLFIQKLEGDFGGWINNLQFKFIAINDYLKFSSFHSGGMFPLE